MSKSSVIYHQAEAPKAQRARNRSLLVSGEPIKNSFVPHTTLRGCILDAELLQRLSRYMRWCATGASEPTVYTKRRRHLDLMHVRDIVVPRRVESHLAVSRPASYTGSDIDKTAVDATAYVSDHVCSDVSPGGECLLARLQTCPCDDHANPRRHLFETANRSVIALWRHNTHFTCGTESGAWSPTAFNGLCL